MGFFDRFRGEADIEDLISHLDLGNGWISAFAGPERTVLLAVGQRKRDSVGRLPRWLQGLTRGEKAAFWAVVSCLAVAAIRRPLRGAGRPAPSEEADPSATASRRPAGVEAARLPPYAVVADSEGGFLTVLVEKKGDPAELVRVARKISEERQVRGIGFIDYPEFAEFAFSLGHWEKGDASNLRQKHWSDRPTQEEVAIWAACQEAMDELEDRRSESADTSADDEAEAIRRVARRAGRSEEEVEVAAAKVAHWLVE